MKEPMKRGFKRKTIEKTIRDKIRHWLKSIDDEELRKDILGTYIVTGGAITSMLLGDLPNDYDIYFSDSSVAGRLARYYVSKLDDGSDDNDKVGLPIVFVDPDRVSIRVKSAGIAGDVDQTEYKYFEQYADPSLMMTKFLEGSSNHESGEYKALSITTNAITLSDKVQIILRFCGDAEAIHKNYDFVHTTNWFTEKGGLQLNLPAVEATLARELRYVGSLYPICSMFRLRKFIKRGWSITAGEMLKISYDISKLDLDDVRVLEDQLTGVDAAYFRQMIALIEEEGKPIDRTYLYELINRVFDDGED